MKITNRGMRISIAVLCMFVAPMAFAQYQSDFDSLAGSAGGTVLTGQDGYFLPNGPPNDADFNVYTYAGNTLGLPQNPNGGTQFIAGIGPAGGTFARAQRLSGFGALGVWTAAFDIAITFTGQLPTAQNIGSFSLNEGVPGVFSIINLARWVDPATASGWNADMVWFDGGGTQILEQVPDVNFQNLAVNHWYRWATDFSLNTNQVLEMRLTDLTTGTVVTHNPADRWLRPGANPDHHRFFGGGGVPGNALAFDNASIVPEPVSMIALGIGLAALAARRRRKK
ncbi:MAG: PEP-CTERM sorting domain-containing protein [Armatimonadetes bacterium]|nr:PEP-CTERM sorting domain-containing protein [Armatimonadota bacterium]